MATIIIKRKSSFVGSVQNHNVYILNTFIGELKNGQSISTPVDIGTHYLSFNSTMKKFGKNATFNVIINDPNEVVELITYFDMNGNYVVKYNDNRPHIPTGNHTTNNQSPFNEDPKHQAPSNQNAKVENINTTQTGLKCPRCYSSDIMPVSEVSTKGKNFRAGDACCGYMICGPLGLLFGATGKGKQTITTTYWMCRGCGNKFQA